MDKRISSLVVVILGIFFVKITLEVSFASNRPREIEQSHQVRKISATEIPHEIN